MKINRNNYLVASLGFIFAGLISTCTSSQEKNEESMSMNLDSLNSVHLNQMEFRRFDKDRDGLISRKELGDLTKAMKQVHADSSNEMPGDRFTVMDSDADGFIALREFKFNLVRDTIQWPGHSYPNIPYKKVGSEFMLMDILMPINPLYKKAPVLYFVHGGGFRSGAKEYLCLNDQRIETALQFAEKGFCCVSVRYRLVNHDPDRPVVLIRDCVTDAWDGLRFLKVNEEQYEIDPEKIIVWGESAGGHIAQMLTFSDPEDFPGDPQLAGVRIKPAAGISWYGPTDFTGSLVQEAGNEAKNRHFRNVTGKSTYSEDDLDSLKEVSPCFQLDSADPPLLLMQGDSDHAVHLSHATHMNTRAQELGANVELVLVKNAGHNWRQVGDPIEPSKARIRDMMLDFALKSMNIR